MLRKPAPSLSVDQFTELTDRLITAFQTKVKSIENGNVIIAKHVMEEKTTGGLILTESTKALENKRSGYGRVIAMARNIKPYNADGEMTGDPDIKVGDYVIFVHEAVYKPPFMVLTKRLEVEYPEEMIWSITDKDIITVFSE